MGGEVGRLGITAGDGDGDCVRLLLMLTNKSSTSATPRLDWDIQGVTAVRSC